MHSDVKYLRLTQKSTRKAACSTGRRHYDGWSPAAIALKAQLVALTVIQVHLHGYRWHSPWHTQLQVDRDLPPSSVA